MGSILAEASIYGRAIHLAKAAGIIRCEMLQHKVHHKNVTYEHPQNSMPAKLLQFVAMIDHGADIMSQQEHGALKSDIAMAHLLQYNCFAKPRTETNVHRHSMDQETPFAVYIRMSVFGVC